MLEYLTDDLREGLREAAIRKSRPGGRLHLRLGEAVFPVSRLWSGGLSAKAAGLTRLRGLVDLYDGPRHIGHCLIVASVLEGGELVCEFKTYQPVNDTPPVDFERTGGVVSGYLPLH